MGTLITDTGDEFKELADNAPVMIWRAGPDRLCDFFNKPWLDFTGRTLEQELGDGWAEGVHPEDREQCLTTFVRAFEERREFSLDYRLRRHDGDYRWVLDNGRPFFRSEGDFSGYFGSCIDITERKIAEEHLKASLLFQDQMLRDKDALTAEVHHRVRNNLQVMLGLVGLSMRHTSDPACQGLLQSFADRIQALAIVQTHLHEADSLSCINLKTYIGQLAHALARLYSSDAVTVSVSGEGHCLPPHDANTVGLILAELLANSFKHAFQNRRAGRIAVNVSTEADGGARITVADDGLGLKLEGPGRQGGIGLTLVRTYAGQIGAQIAYSSANGTQFEIVLRPPQ